MLRCGDIVTLRRYKDLACQYKVITSGNIYGATWVSKELMNDFGGRSGQIYKLKKDEYGLEIAQLIFDGCALQWWFCIDFFERSESCEL